MSKAILVGNGFTSQLIEGFRNESLIKKIWNDVPNEMLLLENFFEPFRSMKHEGNYYFCRYDTNLFPYFDNEDMEMAYRADWYTEEVLSNDALEIYKDIVTRKYPSLSRKAKYFFDRYFQNAGLINEVFNDKISGIESPMMIADIAVNAGCILKAQDIAIRNAVYRAYYNNGIFRFCDCRFSIEKIDCNNRVIKTEIIPSKDRLIDFFNQFSYVFTTNYDLVLDDLVYRKVKHLHGGFNFSSPYKREKVPCGKGNYNIITPEFRSLA